MARCTTFVTTVDYGIQDIGIALVCQQTLTTVIVLLNMIQAYAGISAYDIETATPL